MKNKSFHPHWIRDNHYRDYKIDSIILKDISDDYVLRITGEKYDSYLTEEHVQKFIKLIQKSKIILIMKNECFREIIINGKIKLDKKQE
jgi:hypothetical protein